MENLKYPAGKFNLPIEYNITDLQKYKNVIADFPSKVLQLAQNANDAVLDTPYRPDGWTVRQVIHHCADSHMNAFVRFKLALTEENPTIKPYEEQLWAEMADYKLPIGASIKLLEALHFRWVNMLDNMTEADFAKTYFHPANGKKSTLWQVLALYAWHCEHHLGHIQLVIQ